MKRDKTAICDILKLLEHQENDSRFAFDQKKIKNDTPFYYNFNLTVGGRTDSPC